MTLKQKLISRIDVFNDLYFELLSENNYHESSIIIERLENENAEFPHNPVIQSIWKNNLNNQSFVFRLYENYFIDFEIHNNDINSTLSINDYKKSKNISNIEIYYMQGDISKKYRDYLLRIKDLILATELLFILQGKEWIKIPFDWQGQK